MNRRGLACGIAGALAINLSLISFLHAEPEGLRRQYWATSLSGPIDSTILSGVHQAVARGAVGWLDVDPTYPIPLLEAGLNLILYHVGGNCYIGSDCDRFSSSRPTGDRWGNNERMIDLDDPATIRLVIADLIALVQQADRIAADRSIVGVHLDNVDRLDAQGLANIFNQFLIEVESARQQGRISKTRKVGYVAKNNPRGFKEALDDKLLDAPPLYQINENARLHEDGVLNGASRVAQEIGRRCNIPVFLKTFGSDVAYTIERNGNKLNVPVSQEMAKQMAQLPDISGVAWSADESRYHPTLFVQGSPVRQGSFGAPCSVPP